MARRIFIIACESSGDSHGSELIKDLKESEPDLQFLGLGGPRMQLAGAVLLEDMTKISALGLGDVLRQYFTYRKIFHLALSECRKFQPDVVIVIDSPAFNLRFAKALNNQFPIIYYISPQLWAWGGRRIHDVKKFISQMMVIFPFEKELYDRHQIPCDFVGHPLLETIPESISRSAARAKLSLDPSKKIIGVMPGSRKKEIVRILPVMLEAARKIKSFIPDVSFGLVQSKNVPNEYYESILRNYTDLPILVFQEDIYSVIASFNFALVASGTATLETALIGTPYVLLYKTSWSTYWIGRMLIRVKHLGIVNILNGKTVVPEFIQQDADPVKISETILSYFRDPERMVSMKNDFEKTRKLLSISGVHSTPAQTVLEFLKKKEIR